MKVVFSKSKIKGKKMTAIFYAKNKNGEMKKKKTTHFGSAGMSDYTINKDKERRRLYRARHKKDENYT